jgi:hypothetical protein
MESNFGDKAVFYGDGQRKQEYRHALQIQLGNNRQGVPTMSFEIAPLAADNKAIWGDKWTVQLTPKEVRSLLNALFGLGANSFSTKFHGDNNNKALTIHNNGTSGVSITVVYAQSTRTQLLSEFEGEDVAVWVLRALANRWGVTVTDALALLRQFSRNKRTKC